VPLILTFGIAGVAGTVLRLAVGLAAVIILVDDTILAWKLYNVPAVSPVNVRPVCQAPVPLRNCIAQPGGAVGEFLNVIELVVLLSSCGAGTCGIGGGGITLLTGDHALSVFTLKAPVPLLYLALTSIVLPRAMFDIVVPLTTAHVPPATLHSYLGTN